MSGPARDRQRLKRRIDDFLWNDRSMPMVRLRGLLTNQFSGLGRVAIIGGFVRDIARSGRDSFRSDVDLVIDAPADEVKELAICLAAEANRFGGYAYHHPHWKIDFWALENTWAVVHGHVQAQKLEDLTRATFFDCDAILYDVSNRRVLAQDTYFERLASNEIEINLLPTPSEDGNLLRAIRRVFCWGCEPGPRLRHFISEALDEDRFNRIHEVELRLYADPVTRYFANASALREGLMDPTVRSNLNTSVAEQMRLPGV